MAGLFGPIAPSGIQAPRARAGAGSIAAAKLQHSAPIDGESPVLTEGAAATTGPLVDLQMGRCYNARG